MKRTRSGVDRYQGLCADTEAWKQLRLSVSRTAPERPARLNVKNQGQTVRLAPRNPTQQYALGERLQNAPRLRSPCAV